MIDQDKLRKKILASLLTQQEFAKMVPIENGYFSRFMRGKNVTEEKARQILKAHRALKR